MIFLDANIFLRYLGGATTDADLPRVAVAQRIIEGIIEGDLQATTSEVVIHEVTFVMTSPRQYGHAPVSVIQAMRHILSLPNLRFSGGERELFLDAMDLWEQQPSLGFTDAVIAARCLNFGYELASFDRHFEAIAGVALWTIEPDGTCES